MANDLAEPPVATLPAPSPVAETPTAELDPEFQRMLAAADEPSIVFHGPAFGEAKQRLFETARFLILPSFSEGLPMVCSKPGPRVRQR